MFPARDVEEAMSRIKPGAYQAVLIAGDEEQALRFCEQVRLVHPDQVVIVIAEPHAYIPPAKERCPDEVLRGGKPAQVLETVNAALREF